MRTYNYRVLKDHFKKLFGLIDIGPRVRKAHFLKEMDKIGLFGKVILDAGCGNGEYLFEIINRYKFKELIGFEISKNNVAGINENLSRLKCNNARAFCQDLSENTLRPESIDVCFSIDVLEHIEYDEKVISNIFKWLKKDGLFLLHVPNVNAMRFFNEFVGYHQNDHIRDGYDIKTLTRMLEISGFKILKAHYTTGVLAEIVWEIIMKMSTKLSRRVSQLICFPLTALASIIDVRKTLRVGSGILLLAQKASIGRNYGSSHIDMVILPSHDWKKCEKEGFRTRDAHLIQHFQTCEEVRRILVVDRPTTFPEMIVKKIGWKIKGGKTIKRSLFTCLSQVSQKIFVLDIFSFEIISPLLLKRDWWDRIFRQNKISKDIMHAISYLGLENIVLFLWSPLSTGVIGKLGENMVCFDTLDNWTKHPEIKDKGGYIKERYAFIKESADVIFANSKENLSFMKNPQNLPILIPNGVDKDFFSIREKRVPEDLKNIPKPIVGYAGRLGTRTDTNILSFIAQSLPETSFVICGQFLNKTAGIRSLFKYKNIYFLGDIHYSQLPYYIANFDVSIIPHNEKSLKSGEDPLKLYEYLASGKPVVTTNYGAVGTFKEVITIANSKEEFLKGIMYWLGEIEKGAKLSDKLRKSLPNSCLWAYKADAMIKIISQRISEKQKIYHR